MKIVKKTLTLLLIFSLCVLVLPNNKVLAEEDETINNDVDTQLGGAAAAKSLSIVYGIDHVTKENTIIKYTIEGAESPYSLKQEPQDVTIDNLSVEIDEDFGFVIKISGEVNLSGFYDDNGKVYGLITTSTNLRIEGNGSLNMTIVSNPNPVLEQTSFQSAESAHHKAFIATTGKLHIVGDQKLTVKLDTDINSDIDARTYPTFIDGFVATSYNIENADIDSRIRNSLFYCIHDPENPDPSEEAIVLVKNFLYVKSSIINSRYKPFVSGESEIDNIYKTHHFFYNEKVAKGSVVIDNSKLIIQYNNDKCSNLLPSYAIELNGESSLLLGKSTLKFDSNSQVGLCRANDFIISQCNLVECKYNDTYTERSRLNGITRNKTMMFVNKLNIIDSNFIFDSSHAVMTPFQVETEEEGGMDTGGRFGKDYVIRFGISIVENSKDYYGSIKTTNEDDDVCIFGLTNIATFTAPTTLVSYDNVFIATNGSSIKTRTSTEGLVKNPNVFIADSEIREGNYEGMNAFEYDALGDTPDPSGMIQWKELAIINEQSHNPRHEVLNTGIN